ncbi:MAG: PAS domain S-box protein [Chloroflexota bacterium]
MDKSELTAFLQNLPLGVVYQNLSGEIIYANSEAESLLGLSLAQMQGKTSTDPDWRAIREDGSPFLGEDHPAMQVLAGQQAISNVIMGVFNPKERETRWLRIDAIPEFDSDDQSLRQVISIFSDVTRLKRVEDALAESRDQFQATFHEAAIGIAHVAPDGSWLKVNQRLCDFLGYSQEELRTRTFQDLTHPDDLQADETLVQQLLAGAIESYSMEKRYICKDGQLVWANLTVSLVRDMTGKPNYFISIVEDIRKRKRIETTLRETKGEHEQILDAIDDLVLVKGAQSKILWANRAFREYYGMSNEALAGIIDAPFVELDVTQQYVIDDATVFNSGETLNIPEEPVTRFDGIVRHFNTIKSPIFNQSGTVVKTVGVSRDITRIKQIESEILHLNTQLQHRTTELETINQELNAFAYTVSHDLRAPLRAMIGFSRMLETQHMDDLPEKAQHYIQRIANGAQRMGILIDDLLDFSRIGRQSINKQQIHPKILIEQVIEDLLPQYHDRQIETSIEDLPPCQADAGLLRIVYLNLINNALKFTAYEPVTQVRIGHLIDEDNPDIPIYFVQDNGVGFDMQFVDKIFGVFQRLHRQDEFAGTGVGLATVQKIIHKHGGAIWAASELNHGTTFYFRMDGIGDSDEQG